MVGWTVIMHAVSPVMLKSLWLDKSFTDN